MNTYEYPPLMKLFQIRRYKIKRDPYLHDLFREHWISKVYNVLVGFSAFLAFLSIPEVSGLSSWLKSVDPEFLRYFISVPILVAFGLGIFGLVHLFPQELDILIRQYQYRKQESSLNKQAGVAYSLEDYLHIGDKYLELGNFQKAHTAYSRAISMNPNRWRGYLSRIDCFWLSQGYSISPRHSAHFVSFPSTEPEGTNRDGVNKLIEFAQRIVEREAIFINENGSIFLDQSDALHSDYINLYAPLPADLQQLISDCIQFKRNWNWGDSSSQDRAYSWSRSPYRDIREARGIPRWYPIQSAWRYELPRKLPWWQHDLPYKFFGKIRRDGRDEDGRYYRQQLFVETLEALYDFIPESSPSDKYFSATLETIDVEKNIFIGISCTVITSIVLVAISLGSAVGFWGL